MGHGSHEIVSRLKRSVPTAAALVLLTLSGPLAQALGPLFGIDKEVERRPERIRLLPDDFFDSFPTARAQDIGVEADNLVFDADNNRISAQGNVRLSYQEYRASADKAIYDRQSGDLVLLGNALVRDPEGVVYAGARIEVTGDFRRALAEAFEMQTPGGALITATRAE